MGRWQEIIMVVEIRTSVAMTKIEYTNNAELFTSFMCFWFM